MKRKILQTTVSISAISIAVWVLSLSQKSPNAVKDPAISEETHRSSSDAVSNNQKETSGSAQKAAETPSEAEFGLRTNPMFNSRLFPIGEGGNDADLASLLERVSALPEKDRFAEIEIWIAKNPDSRWSKALSFQLADYQYRRGYFSRAITAWDTLWDDLKGKPGNDALHLGNETLARLLHTNVSVARADRLRQLIVESENRQINGVIHGKLFTARTAVWMLEHTGTQNIMCGPLALNSIAHHTGRPLTQPTLGKVSADYMNTGLPLTRLAKFAEEDYRIPVRMISRTQTDAPFPTPSVAHLSDEHYIAVLEANEDQSEYFIEDKTLGFTGWVDRSALEESSSGNFLLAANETPAGYENLTESSARRIFGRDGAHGTTPPAESTTDDSPTCGDRCEEADGMPRYHFHSLPGSLKIQDTPLFVASPYGPEMDFKLTYNELDDAAPASPPSFSHVGQDWSTGWVAWMDLPSGTLTASTKLSLHAPGSGVYQHSFTTSGSNIVPQTHPQSKAVLNSSVNPSTNQTEYIRQSSDGSTQHYTHISGSRIFLTRIVDKIGNALVLNYLPGTPKLLSVLDAAGVLTELEYSDPSDPLRITAAVNRKGTADERRADLSYDSSGRLLSITDMIDLTSSFSYRTDGFLEQMKTPYGITRFTSVSVGDPTQSGGGSRTLTATDPMGRMEKLVFADMTGSGYTAPPRPSLTGISGFEAPPVTGFDFRNTYFWSKKAWKHYELNPSLNLSDIAEITHWWMASDWKVVPYPAATKNYGSEWVYYSYPGASNGALDTSLGGSPSQILSFTRVNGNVVPSITKMEYNAAQQVTKITDPQGRVTKINYASNLQDVTEVRQVASVSVEHVLGSITYHANRLPHVIKDAADKSTTLTYNARGQISTVTDNVLNRTTTYNYDLSYGYLDNIDGHLAGDVDLTDVRFDSKGRMDQVISPDGSQVTSTFDDFDRITQQTYLDGTFESFTYDRLDLKETTDRLGRKTKYTVNPLQEVTSVTDPQNLTTLYEWCFCGALQQLIDSKGQITKWQYDEGGRQTRKIYNNGKIDVFNYDPVTGQLASTTNKLTESGAPFNTQNFTYYLDGSPQTTSYTDSAIATPSVTLTYETSYPRIATMVDGSGTTTYKYYPTKWVRNVLNGAVGPLAANTLIGTSGLPSNANGAGGLYSIDGPLLNDTITQTFDTSGRPLGRFINGISYGAAMVYDTLDRLQSFSNVIGNYAITYKDANENGLVIPTGRVDRMTMKNTFNVTVGYTDYTYDTKANDYRLLSIANRKANNSNVSTFGYTYNATGRIDTMARTFDALPTSTYTYGYDRTDQLTSALLQQAGAPLKHYSYSYDAAGNRTSKQLGSYVSKATSNALNQLQSVQSGGPTRFYGTVNEPSTVKVKGQNAKVDSQNRFEAFVDLAPGAHVVDVVATDGNGNQKTNSYNVTVDSGSPETFTYDNSGNTLTHTVGAVTTNYEWDAENRMVAIVRGNYRTEFVYDGLDRRVKIIEKNLTTVTDEKRFIWSGIRPAEVRNSANTVTRRYLGVGEQQGTTSLFYFKDHLGSVREALNAAGELKSRYDYSPYGEREKITTNIVSTFTDLEIGYTGHYTYKNDNLGLGQGNELVLPWYRAYNANAGRWLSADPLERVTGEMAEMLPEGTNLYGYVGNNPVGAVDPYGFDMWVSEAGGGHFDVIISDPASKSGLTWYSFAPDHGLGRAAGNWENLSTPGKLTSAPVPTVPPGYLHIPTSKAQDAKALAKAEAIQKKPPSYRALSENCADVGQKILEAGLGVSIKGPEPTTPGSLMRALEFMLKNRSLYGF